MTSTYLHVCVISSLCLQLVMLYDNNNVLIVDHTVTSQLQSTRDELGGYIMLSGGTTSRQFEDVDSCALACSLMDGKCSVAFYDIKRWKCWLFQIHRADTIPLYPVFVTTSSFTQVWNRIILVHKIFICRVYVSCLC